MTTLVQAALYGGAAYSPAALAIFAAFTSPASTSRKSLINRTVTALQTAGVWSVLDALYVTAAADAQAASINWVNPGTYNLTAVNSPAFTADRGYQGDGATSYLDTGMVHNALTHFQQDSATLFAWGTLERAGAANQNLIGDSSLDHLRIARRNGANNPSVRLNDATTLVAPVVSSALGSVGGSRTGAGARAIYVDGVNAAADAQASLAPDASVIYLLRAGAAYNSVDRIGAAAVGGGLNDAQQGALHAAIGAYMQGVGAA